MPRTVSQIGFAFLLGLSVQTARSQPAEPFKTQAIAESSTTQPVSEHLGQLRNIREGLVDPHARPEDRRRWAELLLSYNSEQAKALIVELLGLRGNPDVQRALCRVIADRARQTPERLDGTLLEPLIELLGADADDLRAMAAQALADFPGADVPARLGTLAATTDLPLAKRQAAIDALAPNTHRRAVVGQLISLLDAGTPEIAQRAATALESAAPRTFGSDLQGWRRWWERKSQLSEEAWLAEQLRMYRDRSRNVADEFATHRGETKRKEAAVTARIRDFQRELFRALNGDEREAKLAEWLGEPLPVVKLTAFSIIKAWIADEGKRPEGEVLAVLLRLLRNGSPSIRCEVLEIVQNLNDPSVVEAILAQLEREKDPVTRHAIFRALGKFASPAAIPALIHEISDSRSLAECVREAAIALGSIAAKSPDEASLKGAVAALKSRHQLALGNDPAMRAALLAAMAGVADAGFVPELYEGLESKDATILQPAIRGVLALNDTSKLPRLRTLMAHGDPLVRLAATEAVGQLGREEADLEYLLMRLNPTIESNELPRDTAWRGFRRLLSRRSVGDRIKAAKRLRDLPVLEVKYLEELVDMLATVNGGTVELEGVLDRLTIVLADQGRYAEAVRHLRSLCDIQSAHNGTKETDCRLRLLDAMLRDPAYPPVADLIRQLVTDAQTDDMKAKIVERVTTFLESKEAAADGKRMHGVLADLRSVPHNLMGEAWTRMLDGAAARLEGSNNNPTPFAPPGH